MENVENAEMKQSSLATMADALVFITCVTFTMIVGIFQMKQDPAEEQTAQETRPSRAVMVTAYRRSGSVMV